MDGVDRELVWQLNQQADLPQLAVFLTAPPDVLAARLARRGTHSRYERMADSSATEHRLFTEAATVLTEAGVRVLELDTSTALPDALARTITTAITDLPTPRPP
jgi:dTMP kinase